MLINRIGDLALLIGLSILFFNLLSLKYVVIFSVIQELLNYNFICFGFLVNYIDILCFFLFFGAMGKSAQLGLHM
jgi:NADH:ubiquinone oxidoreductase subunit 5 (subunit L)/multisubunit Na+/H+ antiporter MnhA subunit